MFQQKKYEFYIGIDTGVNTGYAVWNKPEKRLFEVATLPIHEALEKITNLWRVYPGRIFVKVEDARQATFGRQNDIHKIQGAGSVKRDAKIWEDFLIAKGIDFAMARPNKKATKLDKNAFQKITGYTALTSQHARDAALLVFGF